MEEERISERVREIIEEHIGYKGLLMEPEMVQELIDYAIELYWQSTEGE